MFASRWNMMTRGMSEDWWSVIALTMRCRADSSFSRIDVQVLKDLTGWKSPKWRRNTAICKIYLQRPWSWIDVRICKRSVRVAKYNPATLCKSPEPSWWTPHLQRAVWQNVWNELRAWKFYLLKRSVASPVSNSSAVSRFVSFYKYHTEKEQYIRREITRINLRTLYIYTNYFNINIFWDESGLSKFWFQMKDIAITDAPMSWNACSV